MKLVLPIFMLMISVAPSLLHAVHCYSLHRKQDPKRPKIIAHWRGSNKKFEIADSHIEAHPTFSYSLQDMQPYLLPKDTISFRNNPQKMVSTNLLDSLIEQAIREIVQKKRNLTHFEVLQSKNFNHKKQCGLIVLKFKQYPFVVKLFMETPKMFVNPYCKGVEPLCFFFMAGGAGRHTTGLTRIKNREIVQARLNTMPPWSSVVEMPRKWFWLPKKIRLIELTGKNIDPNKDLHTSIPGTYAIIADAIETDSNVFITDKERRKTVMKLCNDLNTFIDPHYNNFIFRKEKGKLKILIIDTEHFPSISGLKQKLEFKSHGSWIAFLIQKCFSDTYLRPKPLRKKIHNEPNILALR